MSWLRKKHFLIGIFVFLLLISWTVYDFFMVGSEGKVNWVSNYDRAMDMGKTENRSVMIYFYTTWCSWCRKLERDTYSNDEVADFLNNNFICLRIDAGKNSDLIALYGIPGYPAMVFLSPEGKELGRILGYRQPDIFMLEAHPYVVKKTVI